MTEHTSPAYTEHLAAAIQYAAQLRDDWSLVQLQAAVELSRRHRDQPDDEKIARALMRAAADPQVRKPSYVPAARLWNALDQVVDDGRSPTAPHECRHCGQPGSTTRPPAHCPACGARWEPITPERADLGDAGTTTTCTSCRHRQVGRFAYCASCGAPMAYSSPAPRPPADAPTQLELPTD